MVCKKSLYYVLTFIFTFFLFHVFLVICEKFNEFLWSRSPVIIYWPPVVDNIQCYSEIGKDVLKSVEDSDFSPKDKSIFFHETSCRGGIDSRQACAVESAARINPDWEVYLLFTSPVNEAMLKRSCLVKLLQYPNVKVARIHVYSYARNTAVSRIISEELSKSKRAVQHTSDIMKMLTLNRWGGIALDLDVLAMKSFDYLPKNWIAKESPYLLASGVMRFSKDDIGRNLTRKVLQHIASTYKAGSWSSNGASAIEKVLMKNCKRVIKRTGDCRGISIYGQELFYPISLVNAHQFVGKGPWPLPQVKAKPYTYCFWNILTGELRLHQKSAFVQLAKKVCPLIYETFGDQFGV